MIYLHDENFIFEHKISQTTIKQHFLNHMHNEWELYYFINGNVFFFVDGITYHLEKGDLLFIPPLTFHFVKPDNNLSYERIVINFPESILPTFLTENIKAFPIYFKVAEESHINNLLNCASSIIKDCEQEEALFAVKGLLCNTLIQMKSLPNTGFKPSNHKIKIENALLKKITDYIDENLTQELSLEKLAKTFYISVSTLSHTFKKFLNITAKKYINYKKILYAQKLIRSGTSVTEAFLQINIQNYSTFFRLYKQFLHVSPESDKQSSKNPQKNI